LKSKATLKGYLVIAISNNTASKPPFIHMIVRQSECTEAVRQCQLALFVANSFSMCLATHSIYYDSSIGLRL